MTTKILLADDHRIIREGLRTLIEKQPDMQVVAEAADGRTAVKLAKDASPDLVIMDIAMPDLNGIEAARQITRRKGVKVIILSMHSEKRFVTEALKAGASGYLLKDSAFEELIRAIQTVVMDKVYLSPAVAHCVVEDLVQRPPAKRGAAHSELSAREREVLQLLAEGKSTKQMALHLHVSVKTIETHRRQIMEKLRLFSVAELTKYAIRQGLTGLEG